MRIPRKSATWPVSVACVAAGTAINRQASPARIGGVRIVLVLPRGDYDPPRDDLGLERVDPRLDRIRNRSAVVIVVDPADAMLLESELPDPALEPPGLRLPDAIEHGV